MTIEFFEFQISAWQVNDNEAQVMLFESPVGGLRRPITVASNAKKLHADFEKAIAGFFSSEANSKQLILEGGKQLSQIILPPPILVLLIQSMERISPYGIRIRLCLDESLIDLPWEYVYAPEVYPVSGFLIHNPRVSIVRETPSISQKPMPSMLKQRLLFAGAFKNVDDDAKKDRYLAKVECEKLKIALENVGDLLKIEFIKSSKDNIQDALLTTGTEIFHYSGHVDEINGRGYLIKQVEENEDSFDRLYSDILAAWLRGTKLAMFSACNSGRWAFVKPLVNAGIPIIIGAYSTITTDAAIPFCEKLYSALTVGLSLDEAVIWARQHLRELEQSADEYYAWGSFMVYMPTKEAVIFPRYDDLEKKKEINERISNLIGKRESRSMDYRDLWIRVKDGDIWASSVEGGDQHDKLNLDLNDIKSLLLCIEKNDTIYSDIKRIGSKLFNTLFPTKIYGLFKASSAGADVCGVRLRLTFDKPELAAIPWEFLYDETTNTFLANDPSTALSRYIDIPLKKQDIKPASLPLKMLLVISSPNDLTPLKCDREESLIKQALKDLINSGQIEIDVLTKATIIEIDQRMNEKPYNVFHFIGHGIFENDTGKIALMDENDKMKLLDDQNFANLFLGKQGLGLVILNSCEGAVTSSHEIFAGIAPLLVQKGVPAVIAMQYSIANSTSMLFADKFYRTLALGRPVDEALQSTRNLISIDVGLNKRDFATPVLFMRAKDGVILDLSKK